MFGSETLEIVLGLVFVYLLFSILSTLLVEYISNMLKLRSKFLIKTVKRLLDDDVETGLSGNFFEHPHFVFLGKDPDSKPSYLKSSKFAKVVLDLIRTGGKNNKLGQSSLLDKNSVSASIDQLSLSKFKEIDKSETLRLLKSFAKEAGEDINTFSLKVEDWFNEECERAQGWYNRRIKVVTFFVSIIIAVGLNVDTIRIYQNLSKNSDLRSEIANSAAGYLQANPTFSPDSLKSDSIVMARKRLVEFYNSELESKSNLLGIGWEKSQLNPFSWKNLFLALAGWLLSALAISIGAPFWFDLLNKVMKLRSSNNGASSGSKTDKLTAIKEGP